MLGEQENKIDWNSVWIDFIEGDVGPELEKDMKELLRLSGEQRNSIETLLCTKEMVKCIDPSHEDYLSGWDKKASTTKIMDSIDKLQRDKWIEENWSGKLRWLTVDRD